MLTLMGSNVPPSIWHSTSGDKSVTKESPTFLLSGVYRAGPACMKKNFAQPESLVTLWNENRQSINRSSQYIYSNLGRHYRNWKPLNIGK